MGGGGLIAGVSAAIKQRRRDVRVIGVEPAVAARTRTASRAAGHPVTLEQTASIADGLMALRPGDLTFAHVQAFVDEVITVLEDCAIVRAIGWLFREARLVVEPSGAVTTAAILEAATPPPPGTIAVVSGGNISAKDYAGYLTM